MCFSFETVKKKYFLTKEGLEKIEEEYRRLKELWLKKIKGDIPRHFRLGEVDPEYLDFRQELEKLEITIAELEAILKNYEIIKPPPKSKRDTVFLGARVTIEVGGQIDEFMIVESIEADPFMGKISKESPVGRSLLGKKVGDEVVVNSQTALTYKIKKIKY